MLTEKQIDEMQSGLKMDLFVARSVLGLCVEIPAMYSIDIKRTNLVITHLLDSDRFETFDLQWYHLNSAARLKANVPWFAIFISFDDVWYCGEGDTPELAICRAALKTTLEKVSVEIGELPETNL